MIKKLSFIFGILFFFSFVSSVTLNQGIVLNSSVSNSSVNFSFSINLTNFTIESNYVSLIGINFTNSTGTYSCEDVNHSTANSIVDSSEFNCSVAQTELESSTETNSHGGSSGYWVGTNEKENREENKLTITIGINKENLLNKKIESNITGLREIEINANERIYGTIEFKVLKEIPTNCKIDENYLVYELFDINENFNISKIESIRLKYGVDKNWIQKNSVKNITVIKCLPHYELLDIKKVNESEKEDYFDIYSNSFSTWAILGIKEKRTEEKVEEKIFIKNNFFEENWYWGLFLVFILIIIYLGFRKKVKRKHKH